MKITHKLFLSFRAINFALYLLLFVCLSSCSPKQELTDSEYSESLTLKYNQLKISSLARIDKKDTLKIKAVNFLLENLKYHYSINGARTMKTVKVIEKYADDEIRLTEELENLNKNDGAFKIIVSDLSQISDTYLISDVELALKSYSNYKWSNNISFFDFCNYILPYRVENEPLSDWRSNFSKYFFSDHDKGIPNKDFQTTIELIHNWLYNKKRSFKLRIGNNSLSLPDLPPEVIDKLNQGTCHDLSILSISILRSLGIPSTIDYTPMFLNQNNGHEWCIAMLNKQKPISFDITAPTINHTDSFYKPSKVYRKLFMPNDNNYFSQHGYNGNLPLSFNDPFAIDVTSFYTKTSNISFPVNSADLKKNDYCYVAVFTINNWYPVDYGKVIDSKCVFKNLGRGGVYLPIIVDKNEIKPINYPIILLDNGEIKKIIPDTKNLGSVRLLRKFPLNDWKTRFINRMVGGIFQGANSPDFSDAVNLFQILQNPGEHKNTITVNDNNKYRYVRYLSPIDGHGNVAELEFYSNDCGAIPLKGKTIGTTGSWLNDPTCTNNAAFDGNPLTYFDADKADSVWLGIDLGKRYIINKICFLARNDMNSIQKGHNYELFYWNNLWKSLGKQIANTTSLRYDSVPKKALLWLKDLTTGTEERIFTYENKTQTWW